MPAADLAVAFTPHKRALARRGFESGLYRSAPSSLRPCVVYTLPQNRRAPLVVDHAPRCTPRTRPIPNAPLSHELAGVFFFASSTTLFSYSFRSLTNRLYASDWAGEFGFGVSSRSWARV